jgi:hypothetical protein
MAQIHRDRTLLKDRPALVPLRLALQLLELVYEYLGWAGFSGNAVDVIIDSRILNL